MNNYQYIVNPNTNRKCRIDTALGKRIIRQYVNNMKGGSRYPNFINVTKQVTSVFSNNDCGHSSWGCKTNYN